MGQTNMKQIALVSYVVLALCGAGTSVWGSPLLLGRKWQRRNTRFLLHRILQTPADDDIDFREVCEESAAELNAEVSAQYCT